MINAFYAREKKRHSAAQHTGENPFGHTVQWLQTNKYEIYISTYSFSYFHALPL